MAGFVPLEVPVDEAALLLHVQPATIRRRLRAGELKRQRVAGRDIVVLDPAATWLRADDVGALLGLTAPTVRAAIGRGELAGRRERTGRWLIRLQSVLDDRRCDPDVVARFGGEGRRYAPAATPAAERPPGSRFRRMVTIGLSPDEAELLERARARYGTMRESIVAALRAADADDSTPGEIAELRVEHDLYRDEAQQARDRAAQLTELARRRFVDAVYCPQCERLVPLEEAGYEVEPDGTVAIFHELHGYRAGSRVRASTVMARRRAIEESGS